MLLGVSGSGLALSYTTGVSLTPWHRPAYKSHSEWWQRMLTKPQNILGPWNHSNGHIWDRFTFLGLIWQISTTNFLSRFVWSQDMVQAKCFALFVYLGYGFGCLAGKKNQCLWCSFQISFWQLDGKGMPPQRRDHWGEAEVVFKGKSGAVHCRCHRITTVIRQPLPWSDSEFCE